MENSCVGQTCIPSAYNLNCIPKNQRFALSEPVIDQWKTFKLMFERSMFDDGKLGHNRDVLKCK